MTWRTIVIVFASLSISACDQAEPEATLLAPDARFGIVSHSEGTLCLSIKNSGINLGAVLQISDGDHFGSGTITAARPEPCRFPDMMNEGFSHYAVAASPELPLGIVAVASTVPGNQKVHSCTSAEGIHFTVWSGEPLASDLLWHSYYYLGYDTTPTCTEPGEWGEKPG